MATATSKLSGFSLDLRGLTVSAVTVNFRPATFSQADGELLITPQTPLVKGLPFVVTVAYGGTTGQPDGQHRRAVRLGVVRRRCVRGQRARGCEHLVPGQRRPLRQGHLQLHGHRARRHDRGRQRRSAVPGAPATARPPSSGRRSTRWPATCRWRPPATTRSPRHARPSGCKIINAVDDDLSPAQQASAAAVLALQPEMIDFFSARFGPYPFSLVRRRDRRRRGRRLRPREPDPADLLRRPVRTARSPTSWPTSGTATRSRRSSGRTSG